ncbi:DUF262 domain-containing protein [Clostridium sp. OS1-26]|uniref:DUF262 domain-containing protein n=1 Tax=Clostridium sp. OS1-26 TaxID=3070681 RepID=UPI0027DEDF42|nr:DUF262 domain-containing protein [Clostridium sp. OS1-26]WML33417.1 DUF262 domain-containing protein [Clostridium sp. OS1-26]
MKTKTLPLKELSIAEIYNGDKATYEVPIYQRNYAWEKDEISALIQDVYDAYTAKNQTYFIGTLVSFHKGDQVYEVIDGQQRLTTINLVLGALGISLQNKLTYRARKKSNDTIQSIPCFEIDEKDYGIVKGFKYAKDAINEIVQKTCQDGFKTYFQHSVHLIHYQVPKDIDLNHYFEIMNSRGEQLEKHEIIKARLIEKLNNANKAKFNRLWEFCSEMNVYIQQKYREPAIFGKYLCDFKVSNFDDLPKVDDNTNTLKISDLINYKGADKQQDEENKIDTFQPIMDFTNFLLIVLKLTRIEESSFDPTSFNLDDKELIHEFDKVQVDEEFVKTFGSNLLRAKFLLDNYIVHHSNEDDTIENNPWKLQYWQKDGKKEYLKNLDGESDVQHKLVQILSMFEVSFTARQRKNYLFYCLLYLFRSDDRDINKYCEFLSGLADKYFKDVYLVAENLNEINTPKPGSFDNTVLCDNALDITPHNDDFDFTAIYGDGTVKSKGIPLFVFNYLDYKLWEKYANELRGERTKEGGKERTEFFATLGCGDFGLKVFEQFYFSRTRRSLEHYYPQANANGENGAPNEEQINCLGNYAMIGSEANSSGSNWSPKTKLDHYLDASGKIKQVSVASIKFMIMMQKCKDNQNARGAGQEWNFDDIKAHQEKMSEVFSHKREYNL